MVVGGVGVGLPTSLLRCWSSRAKHKPPSSLSSSFVHSGMQVFTSFSLLKVGVKVFDLARVSMMIKHAASWVRWKAGENQSRVCSTPCGSFCRCSSNVTSSSLLLCLASLSLSSSSVTGENKWVANDNAKRSFVTGGGRRTKMGQQSCVVVAAAVTDDDDDGGGGGRTVDILRRRIQRNKLGWTSKMRETASEKNR